MTVKVLFVSSHSQMGGSERYLLNLLSVLEPGMVSGVLCLQDGPLVQQLQKDGYPVETIATGAGAIAVAGAARRVRRRLPGSSLVHANGIKAAVVSVAASGRSVPVVWVKHDFSWDGWPARILARRCACVVGVSRAVLQALPARARGQVVNPGIPQVHVDPVEGERAVRAIVPHGPVVAHVGRLHPVKGQTELIEAAPLVLEGDPKVSFLFVGGEDPAVPDHREELVARASDLGIADRVHLVGYRSDVRHLVTGSDVLAVTTIAYGKRYGREGFGLAALEAMASGTPVVAYSEGALPEVLGDCGSLVPEGDRAALAREIVRVLSDSAASDAMSDCGRTRAARMFSLETMKQQMERIYVDTAGAATS